MMPRFLRRLRARLKYRHFERDLAQELEIHRAMVRRAVEAREGGGPDAARLIAHALGNTAIAREDSRAMWIPVLVQQLAQDARYALRGFRRQPGFSLAAVTMLTLGLGLVAAGYTVANGLFLRGWTVPDSASVFRVRAERAINPAGRSFDDGLSYGAFKHIRANAKSADYVAYRIENFDVKADGDPGRGTNTPGLFVSDNLFEALQIPLQLGTGLAALQGASEPGVVISDRVWQQIFGADPRVIGRAARLGEIPVRVVGVTARGFRGLAERPLDVVADIAMSPRLVRRSAERVTDDTACCVMVAGRIRKGWSREHVREELDVLTGQYRQAVRQPALAVSLYSTVFGDGTSIRQGAFRTVLALIGVGLILVLLLTCANVGNLYLARSLRREREIAVRLSLGASRARLVRQLLTEGLVLSAIAGTGAFLLTVGVPVLFRLLEDDDATASMFPSDWRVATFTVMAAVIASLLVSLAPALQTTRIAWRGGTASMSPRAGRMRGVVLAAQIAIAAVLVVSGTLIARGIGQATSAPTDFALHTTSIATIRAPAALGYDTTKATALRVALARAAQASDLRPGLAKVSPQGGRLSVTDTYVTRAQSEGEVRAHLLLFSAAALDLIEVRLASGRWASDDPVASELVVNETLAKQMWPGENALGQTLAVGFFNQKTFSVVGIARDAHLTSFERVEPMVLLEPSAFRGSLPVLIARTGPNVDARLKALVASVDPGLVVTVSPLSESMSRSLESAMMGAGIAGSLAVLALLLAVIGVFGVFSYLVEERRREIGIRLALGATRRQIRVALFDATKGAVAGGLVAGLILSAVAGQALRGFLLGLSPVDPISYAIVALVLLAAALLATAIPVRRALRVDPAVTLKCD